jgi:type VI secretion system secreted protein Hcp
MTRSRLFKLALPAAVVLGAGTAVAIAAIPASDGTIHACYATTAASPTLPGQLRVVDEGVTCATTEQALTFNQQGPAGPAGPQGEPGFPGDSGTDTGGGTGTGSGSPFDTSQAGGPSADIFLAIDGIQGDSTDARHKNQIAIESFAFLAKRPTTSSSRGSTAVRFNGLRLDKVYDVSSPKLFAAATSGRHLKNATVTFSTSSDASGTDVLTYKLTDVMLTSYEQGGANPDMKALGSLEEEIGLTAARVSVTEKTFNAAGKPGPAVIASWQVPKASRR